MKGIHQKSLELCWEIEKLPASELQTKVSIMASELSREVNDLFRHVRAINCTEKQPNKFARCHVDAVDLSQESQKFGGDIVHFHCPYCDLRFETELPQ